MKIYPVMHDQIHDGVVWLGNVKLKPRSAIKIYCKDTNKSIYCEALEIDNNFLEIYNKEKRNRINKNEKSMVLCAYHRSLLGGLKTKETYSIEINSKSLFIYKILPCIHHPQLIVRVATWLGVLSFILGIISLIPR